MGYEVLRRRVSLRQMKAEHHGNIRQLIQFYNHETVCGGRHQDPHLMHMSVRCRPCGVGVYQTHLSGPLSS